MVLDLLFDTVYNAAYERPEHRTRLQQAAVYLGLIGLLFGAWITVSSRQLSGPVVAIIGCGLLLYGR